METVHVILVVSGPSPHGSAAGLEFQAREKGSLKKNGWANGSEAGGDEGDVIAPWCRHL